MNEKPNPLQILNSIAVKEPCHESWDKMTGDQKERFCDSCNKSVHNLSEMTTAEAADLLSKSTDRVCVRYQRNVDGSIDTLDRKDSSKHFSRRMIRRIMVSAASLCGISFATGCDKDFSVDIPFQDNVRERSTMGEAPPSFQQNPQPLTGKVRMGDVAPIQGNVIQDGPTTENE